MRSNEEKRKTDSEEDPGHVPYKASWLTRPGGSEV